MIVQNPTLLEGSITGVLRGTSSFALTASYALNLVGQVENQQSTYIQTIEFDKSTTGMYLSNTIPAGALLSKIVVRVDTELTEFPTKYMYFRIGGATPIDLASEQTHFESQVGAYTTYLGLQEVLDSNSGSFGYEVIGSGATGTGIALLEYYKQI